MNAGKERTLNVFARMSLQQKEMNSKTTFLKENC